MNKKSTSKKVQVASQDPAQQCLQSPPQEERAERRTGEGAHSAMKQLQQQELQRSNRRNR